MTKRQAHLIVGWIWEHRWICVLACLIITVLAALPLRKLEIDNSIAIWFMEDDPTLIEYRRFQRRFGNDEVVVIALNEPEGMLTPAGLERVRRVSQVLRSVKGVARVVSLATVAEKWRIKLRIHFRHS